MKKNISQSKIQLERMWFKELTLHKRNGYVAQKEWICSLEEMQGVQNCDNGRVDTFNNDLDTNFRIFCNGVVNKEANKLGIECKKESRVFCTHGRDFGY